MEFNEGSSAYNGANLWRHCTAGAGKKYIHLPSEASAFHSIVMNDKSWMTKEWKVWISGKIPFIITFENGIVRDLKTV